MDKEYHRLWRANNPDKIKAAVARYRAKHAERIKERERLRFKENAEAIREYRREYARAWRIRNPERVKAARDRLDPEKIKENRLRAREKRRLEIKKRCTFCACGCGAVVESIRYPDARYIFGHHKKGREQKRTIPANLSPRIVDVYWIAGFLEGEGSFSQGGIGSWSCGVQCTQVQREPLERLQNFLGGGIVLRNRRDQRNIFKSVQPSYVWQISGSRARGLMMTIYSLMSPKRQEQIQKALGEKLWASKEN